MIHQYKLNGYNIVIDVASGSVHVVDEVAYDIIGMYKEKSQAEITDIILEKYSSQITAEEIAQCFDAIRDLEENELLFTEED